MSGSKTLAEVAFAQPSNIVYDVKGPAAGKSPSDLFAVMDQELAAQRNAAKKVTEDSTPKVITSRIRVQLSRPLTWAEKEAVETNHNDIHARRINNLGDGGFRFWVSPSKEHIWAEADFGSRLMFDLIAAVLEQHFVNVYPTAVRTFREYNGE